ncbi:MAG: hypothetical protein HYX69_16150 [Planctomycetia bacterium]|nr:hypothetical protein [Planctomycetia bacterium]
MLRIESRVAALRLGQLIFAAAIALTFGSLTTVEAAVFTIDPNLSMLNFSGTDSNGDPLSPQSADSFTASLSGTIVADVVAGTIAFPGGSASALETHPGPFSPFGLPANFAGTAGNPVVAVFAIRNEVSDIVGAARPIDFAGNFSAAAALPILAGTFDYFVPSLGAGSIDLTVSPGSTSNTPALDGLLQQVGNQLILTIPVDTTSQFFNGPFLLGTARYLGQVVATAEVPEPSAAWLAAAGAVCCLAIGRHARAKNVLRQTLARR